MRPETSFQTLEQRADAFNRVVGEETAEAILRHALDSFAGRVAVVSSFGAESVVLLHLVASLDRSIPVLFIDTEMLFPATIAYQTEVAGRLGLNNVRRIRPDRDRLFRLAPDGDLHHRDPDLCCHLRKTVPLETALAPFAAWISGRKRHQTPERAALRTFEADASGRMKINPLAGWSREDVAAYFDLHDLPRHPLVGEGFLSIGCAPCTTRVADGEDPRAGRWRGSTKTECGIHLADGRYVRSDQNGGKP